MKLAVQLSLLTLLAIAVHGHKIRHVVVLMEENRSMDHMFGFSRDFPGLDVLTGKETNPLDTTNPSAGSVRVSADSPYIGPCDPNHGLPATTKKIFGMAGMATQKDARMDGFVEFERNNTEYCGVMKMFAPGKLPVLMTLAKEFAVFNNFFASVPGPTWPNRMFCLAGTSAGDTETNVFYENIALKPYPQPTIFDSLAKVGLSWRNYYDDVPWELFLATLQDVDNRQYIQPMSDFERDAAAGTLPTFSWVNPRASIDLHTGAGSNDQHPDHDVRLGEALIKSVYETLRASPAWNETLLIITYDEHGGFYDHVPTPLTCPAPDDDRSYPDNFDFKRLGLRIPTLLVSPWIKKGRVITEKPAGPAADSEFELTSIIATVKKMFGLPDFLTRRDAWAGTFDHLLDEMSEPRTDCPRTMPDAPTTLDAEAAQWEADQPLNELQFAFVRRLSDLNKVPLPAFTRQGQLSAWFKEQTRVFLRRKE